MSLRRILVLLLLVAGLGAYLYFYEVPQARKAATKEKLLAVDKDAVTGVSLVYPDREIELRKDDRGWRLVKPMDAPADEATVKALVATLADAEVQKSLDELPKDLAPFGLDKPAVTARLTVKSGEAPPAIAVGKNTAIGGKTYVRKGDEPKLYLTATTVQFGLKKEAKDLRDKQLVAFQDDDVSRIEVIQAGEPPTALVRKDKDAWTVDPGGHVADPTEVRSYLSSLRSTRAVDFPDDAPADLAKYGLTAPRLAVRVLSAKEGAAPVELLLGGETTQGTQKQIYAKRGDQPNVYAVGDWSFRTLAKTAGQFRDKTVLGFDPARVGKVALERREGTGAVLVRGDGGWKVEGSDKPPKADAVTRFLDDLKDLRGAEIAAEPPGDLARFGLDAPALRITLTDKDGQAMGTVLATKREAKYSAMRADGGTVYEVRDYMYTRLDKQLADFLEPPAGTTATTLPVPPMAEDEDAEPDEEPLGDEEEE